MAKRCEAGDTEIRQTDLNVFDGKRIFIDVSSVGTTRQRTKRRQITAVAAKSFTHKCPVLTALSRLFHTITDLPPTITSNYSTQKATATCKNCTRVCIGSNSIGLIYCRFAV